MSDLDDVASALLESYASSSHGQHINRQYLPAKTDIIDLVRLFLELFYPGYFGRQDLTSENVEPHVRGLLGEVEAKLTRQLELCMCFEAERRFGSSAGCRREAERRCQLLLARLPAVRAVLLTDAEAAVDGDPAATSLDEVILAYPGFLAITVHRVAHELYSIGQLLLARIMSEWAHGVTGADIHPGATIGPRFFIDHATGVVIGETTRIGRNVKIYQGVTLGAVSHPRDETGRVIRGSKRHPTVEDGVTIYANSTILGGGTVVGENSVIGGSVFLTRSVPPGSKVAVKPPELNVKTGEWIPDFNI